MEVALETHRPVSIQGGVAVETRRLAKSADGKRTLRLHSSASARNTFGATLDTSSTIDWDCGACTSTE